MKHKNLKFCHLFNLITFKLFLIGFTINFVAFMNSNWIKNDSYVYGIFQYCTNNINIEYDDSVNIFEFIEINSQKLSNSGVRCFNWSKANRPKFIFRFLILQGGCLACHLALLISIIVLKLLASKWWLKRIKKTAESKIFDKPSCLNSAKFSLYLNFCFCGAGFLLTSFYCTNLILFHLDQSLTNPAISNEQLSWCFWLSVIGSAITFISICALLAYTIYFKKIKNNSELTSRHETNSKYSLRDFIDAYKKSNSPFYSTNLNCSLPPVPPNSSFASLGIDSYNPNGEMKSTSEDKTESDPTKDNSNSNTDGNVFYKENSSSLSDSNISKKESIISGEQDEALKSKQNIDNKKVKPQIAIKTTAVPMPSSFIYSQVYPCGKKEKLIQNNKDPMLKMVVLPFGSLSGNIPSNNCNNTENQRDESQKH